MLVTLKKYRTEWDGKVCKSFKIEKLISPTLTLANESTGRLDLLGFICHSGSLEKGHNYAYRRVDQLWYKLNDRRVDRVEQKEVLSDGNGCVFLFELRL